MRSRPHGRHEGRAVCLCWRLGEESVSHWHEVDAGFSGRQEITADFVAADAAMGEER